MNRLTLDVTELGLFSGLYESIWRNSDMDIDSINEIAEQLNVNSNDIETRMDFSDYRKAIAEIYCEQLQNELEDYEGIFEIESVYSPLYYNFDTDHIIINWNSTMPLEEMESRLKELIENSEVSNWSFEMTCWDRQGLELYNNSVRYLYKGIEVWYGMDRAELDRLINE